MKNLSFFILLLFFIATSLQAKMIEGDYDLNKGPKECPIGSLMAINNRIIFGTRHVWIISQKENEDHKEVVEGGCTYITRFKNSATSIVIKTMRSSCPHSNENASISEELQFKNNQLIYMFDSEDDHNKKISFSCEYKKNIIK